MQRLGQRIRVGQVEIALKRQLLPDRFVQLAIDLDIHLVESALVHIGESAEAAENLVAAGLVLFREQQPTAPVEFDEEDLLAFALQKKPAPFDRARRHGRNGRPVGRGAVPASK